ncbi:MAG: hypothetical protein L0210_05700, partial [Rhodospirillales bacterium]|nr:hypothetical protein [Rhodospirillales bacterium]
MMTPAEAPAMEERIGAAASARPGARQAKAIAWMEAALALFIGLELLFKYQLLFRLNINWDEFFFLSKIYDYRRGELSGPLQTFYVHFFGWLPLVSGNEVTQIIAARGVMYAVGLGSCLLTYSIGR